jgi:hypothetical protein
MRDSQLTELSGRHFLIAQLVAGGLEVAIPVRDRGIDLIAYLDLSAETKRFVSSPIQMKASQEARFSIDRKYERIANLILAFVWHVEDPAKACVYALTYQEAFRLIDKRGHTRTPSWLVKKGWSVRNPGKEWMKDLEPYRMTPDRWRQRIESAAK